MAATYSRMHSHPSSKSVHIPMMIAAEAAAAAAEAAAIAATAAAAAAVSKRCQARVHIGCCCFCCNCVICQCRGGLHTPYAATPPISYSQLFKSHFALQTLKNIKHIIYLYVFFYKSVSCTKTLIGKCNNHECNCWQKRFRIGRYFLPLEISPSLSASL